MRADGSAVGTSRNAGTVIRRHQVVVRRCVASALAALLGRSESTAGTPRGQLGRVLRREGPQNAPESWIIPGPACNLRLGLRGNVERASPPGSDSFERCTSRIVLRSNDRL